VKKSITCLLIVIIIIGLFYSMTNSQTNTPYLPPLPKPKEKPIESLPSIIKRIEPSTVIVFTYDNKVIFLRLGSGFFVGQNGNIVTNYHILQGASYAEVKTSYGKTYLITNIVAEDEQSDLIIFSIDIPSQYIHPLSLSTSLPEVGERIIAYGSPLGLEKTVSDGIISAIREVPGYGKLIQITAPISPGSSGSPVLNMKGEIIGIATFQFIEGQNLNFAIPSKRISSLNSAREKKTTVGEGLFEQEEKGKKDYEYDYEAYDKALYFIDKREYETALPYLEIAIKTDISSLKSRAYFQIGYCYLKLKSYAKAIKAYNELIRIDPDNANTYSNLGFAYRKLGNHNKAIEACKQAISINPDDANAYSNLSFSYYNLRLYKDAIEACQQTIRINPDDVNIHFILGFIYLLIGDKSSTLNEYKILKELDIDKANKLFDLIY
jgi:serine protease Do